MRRRNAGGRTLNRGMKREVAVDGWWGGIAWKKHGDVVGTSLRSVWFLHGAVGGDNGAMLA